MRPVRTTITRDDVEQLVALACRAPSVHNTQPWKFRYEAGSVELRADPARRLPLADPGGRELLISCGAALGNLELGIRGLGLEPRVHRLPSPADPLLLATVCGRPGKPAAETELRLLAAIPHRHSHRGPFTAVPPAPALLAELGQVARGHGAHLAIIPEGPRAQKLRRLAWVAEATQHEAIGWALETRDWVAGPGSQRRDGVPHRAYGSSVVAPEPTALPARDFDRGCGWGTGDPAGQGGSVLAMLLTDGDRALDWLRAGTALQYVLLRAAVEWAFASFATQPLELPEVRLATRQATQSPRFPQMIFQLGHAKVAPQTPRRAVCDVLTVN